VVSIKYSFAEGELGYRHWWYVDFRCDGGPNKHERCPLEEERPVIGVVRRNPDYLGSTTGHNGTHTGRILPHFPTSSYESEPNVLSFKENLVKQLLCRLISSRVIHNIVDIRDRSQSTSPVWMEGGVEELSAGGYRGRGSSRRSRSHFLLWFHSKYLSPRVIPWKQLKPALPKWFIVVFFLIVNFTFVWKWISWLWYSVSVD